MNPRSDTSSAGGPAPSPVHSHELTQAEVLELGVLAVEEPHEDAATVAPMGIPASSPLPPTTVVAPQATASPQQEAVVQDTAPQPVIKRGIVQPLTTAPSPAPVASTIEPAQTPAQQPATTESVAAPTGPGSQDVAHEPVPEPASSPSPVEPSAVVAPKATPSKAPDVAAPVRPTPPLIPEQTEVSAPQPVLAPSVISADRMELSANSMNLKSISRLRALGVIMNVFVIVLIIGVIAGGWYVYKYVLKVQ